MTKEVSLKLISRNNNSETLVVRPLLFYLQCSSTSDTKSFLSMFVTPSARIKAES